MDFVVKTAPGVAADVVEISPEIIANQRVGSRLAFRTRHDLTVEFANGAVMVDDIDLVVYVVPGEFFCYRGDDFVVKFAMESRALAIDCRPAIGRVNARAILSAVEKIV